MTFVMVQRARHTQTPGRQAVDYTDRAYWNGLIKMSLSKLFILCVLQTRSMHGYEIARTVERTTHGCCSPQCLVQSECVMVESTACCG